MIEIKMLLFIAVCAAIGYGIYWTIGKLFSSKDLTPFPSEPPPVPAKQDNVPLSYSPKPARKPTAKVSPPSVYKPKVSPRPVATPKPAVAEKREDDVVDDVLTGLAIIANLIPTHSFSSDTPSITSGGGGDFGGGGATGSWGDTDTSSTGTESCSASGDY